MVDRHQTTRKQLDKLFLLDATASLLLGGISLLAPHGFIQALSGGYNHNTHEALRLYGCLRIAVGWMLFNVRAVDDGRFRRSVCEALCVCYALQSISVLRAQFTDSSGHWINWVAMVFLVSIGSMYGRFRFGKSGDMIKVYELPTSSRMRLLILTCIALFVFHGPSLCGAVRMSRAGSETSATFKAEESGDLHIYGSLLVLISNAINGLRQISSNLHDTLTQEIKYDGISLDKMYLDHLHKTMESLLLNATLMARKLESDSQSMVEQNQSMAVVENDYSSYSIPNYNKSKTEIDELVSDVLDSNEKAKALADDAIQAFDAIKNQTMGQVVEEEDRVRHLFQKNIERISSHIQNEGAKTLHDIKEEALSKSTNSGLLDPNIWISAGYTTQDANLCKDKAKMLIKSVSLESFQLRNDAKKDHLLVKDTEQKEARTRTHIGVRDWSNVKGMIDGSLLKNDPMVDSGVLLHYNVGALSKVADDIELKQAKLEALFDILGDNNSSPRLSIDRMRAQVNGTDGFETLTDLAFRAASLEAKVGVQKILSLAGALKYSLKEDLTKCKSMKMIKIMQQDSASNLRIMTVQNRFETKRVNVNIEQDVILSSIMELLKSGDRLLADTNSTARKLNRIVDKANSEIMHTKHRIDAETKEERKQEHFSLEKIKVAGEEASKSMLEMIETLFTHLIQGLGYIVSEEDGRHQAFMFVAAASILALSISMSKEAIELIFYLLIRSLSMPRLVREWGRASDNGFYRRQIKSNLLKDVVLREKDKKQIEDICNIVDIGRKRNAPLRNILLHGSVGTGKSITARAIAEASNLPYAIMSGADIAPLGHQGPSELRRLLAWASGKKNGGILVIDEAESALGKRLRETDASSKANEKESQANDASSSARDALNIFLGMTGETGGKLMLILTTSNPSALDSAVLDRCDHVICCSMPSSEERKEIIKRELEKRFKKQPLQCKGFGVRKLIMKPKEILSYGDDFDLSNATNHLSDDKMTGGFSGRELSTIIRALETAAYSDRCVLTMEIFNRVESEICSSIRTKKALKSCG